MAAHDPDVARIARIEAVPRILQVVCRTTGMGFAAVARVTEDRWVACAVHDEIGFGIRAGGEVDVKTTICNEIRQTGHAVVIDQVAQDAAYCRHPVPAMYGFHSYISIPIVREDGSIFGTLCALDRRPARVNNPETIGMFKLFAELISVHLEAEDRLAASEAALSEERRTAELREQFVSVLGHDLRNPLTAIDAEAMALQRELRDPRAAEGLEAIRASSRRMAELIRNVLDLARARPGGPWPIQRDAREPLDPVLDHVVAETRAAHPDRVIETSIAIPVPVYCDRARVAQLLSNLLANALTHGSSDDPVSVSASVVDGVFELTVANSGPPVPIAAMARLFQPFATGTDHKGLGLGLYIAYEIARAHGGILVLARTGDRTRFSLRMPADARTSQTETMEETGILH